MKELHGPFTNVLKTFDLPTGQAKSRLGAIKLLIVTLLVASGVSRASQFTTTYDGVT